MNMNMVPPFSALAIDKAVPVPAYYRTIISAATGPPSLPRVPFFHDSGFIFISHGVFLLPGAPRCAIAVDNKCYLISNGIAVNGRCGDFPVIHDRSSDPAGRSLSYYYLSQANSNGFP
jgi:hypothetical protein